MVHESKGQRTDVVVLVDTFHYIIIKKRGLVMKHFYKIMFLGSIVCSSTAHAGTIVVTPERPLRNSTGFFRCTLWSQADGFPIDYAKAAQRVSSPISGNQSTCTFSNVSAGKYAISVLHDENDDKKMETNAVGAPEEGFGFSNEAKPENQRTPSFDAAAFDYDGSNKDIQLMVLYRRPE